MTFGMSLENGAQAKEVDSQKPQAGVKPQHCSEPYAKPMSCPTQKIQQQLLTKALR